MDQNSPRTCDVADCPLYGQKPVWDYYDRDQTEILFIAEAPGETEDQKGRPLCGMAGGILFQALHHAGLAIIGEAYRSYTWTNRLNLDPVPRIGLSNVVHCRPPGNRTPSQAEIRACKPWLDATLADCRSLKAIVTMGDVALDAVLHEKQVTKRRGMPALLGSTVVVPTVHPAYLTPGRSPEWFDLFVKDILKAVRLAETGWSEPALDVRDLSEESVASLLVSGFAFDIETTGLSPFADEIIGIAFSNEPGVAYHAWRDNIYQWELAVKLLESKAYKIAQGNSFDVPFLHLKGVNITNVQFDTQYAQKLVEPDYPATLSAISSYYLDYPYYKGQRDELIGGRLSRDQTREYCGRDAAVTLESAKHLREKLVEHGVDEVFETIVMPSSEVANRLQIKGVKIDMSKRQQAHDEIKGYVQGRREVFKRYGWNIDSPVQLKELFGMLKLRLPSTDRETLERYYHRTGNKLLKAVLEYRPWSKLESTLFGKDDDAGLFARIDESDCIHSRFKPNGTANSRWSSSGPNLQNIPPSLRYLFIPTSSDHNFMEADYTRLELFVAAILSGDDILLRDVETTPIHDNAARLFFGENYTENQRRIAKTVVFGTLYGRSARAVAVEFNITVKEAARLQAIIAAKYKVLSEWVQMNLKWVQEKGYLRSAFGRIRYYSGGNLISDAANYPVQTAAGDITNGSLILLDKNPLVDIRLTVHDSIIIQYPAGQEGLYSQLISDVMSRPIPQLKGYKFPIKISTGPNWGEMREYNT